MNSCTCDRWVYSCMVISLLLVGLEVNDNLCSMAGNAHMCSHRNNDMFMVLDNAMSINILNRMFNVVTLYSIIM